MTSLISAVFGDKSKDDDKTESKDDNTTESKDNTTAESKDNTTTEGSDAPPETNREATDNAQSDRTMAGGSQAQAKQAEVRQPQKAYEGANYIGTAGVIPCPDPSVHGRNTKLQEQASNAALYTTRPQRKTDPRGNILGPDQKLSSASAAASLKYASPQQLPSFPVVGIDTTASANSAANLANAHHKNVELWRPDVSSAAGKAALLAKDYKMNPLWKPEASAAGSKAALLAAKDGGKVNIWTPEAHAEGNSAANIAMREKGLSPQLDYGYTEDGHKKALMAATGALSGRQRAGSTPTQPNLYPDQANSAHNALNAARGSVRDANRLGSAAMEAARVKNLGKNMPREMFTEHPPVAIEVEEKRHQEALHASAISMAKKMYELTQARAEELAHGGDGLTAARGVHGRQPSARDQEVKQQATQYMNLQEAAQKLAAERLAKLKQPDEAAIYRQYYGYDNPPPKSRLSIRRGRRRANSEGEPVDSDDEQQSRRIRSQMSKFDSDIAQVDSKKRQKDRDALLAAAERRVQAQMHNMDEKVFADTGKVPPAMMEEWEAKARARAAADSEARMVNHGKVHIGGGKFMDQSEIDAIAAARLQPTLNEINEAAEKQRARDEEIRLDQEEKKRQAQREKERLAREKDEQKRLKAEQKAAARNKKDAEKIAAHAAKDAEKAKKAEEKRVKEEQRRSKEVKRPTTTESAPTETASTVATVAAPTEPVHATTSHDDDDIDPKSPVPTAPVTEGRPAIAAVPSYHEEVERIGTSSSSLSSSSESDLYEEPSPRQSTSAVPKEVVVPKEAVVLEEVVDEGVITAPPEVVAERVLTSPVTDYPEDPIPLPPTLDTSTTLTGSSTAPKPSEDTTRSKSTPSDTATLASATPASANPAPARKESRVKSLLGKFKRHPKAEASDASAKDKSTFVGGATLTGGAATTATDPTPAPASQPAASSTQPPATTTMTTNTLTPVTSAHADTHERSRSRSPTYVSRDSISSLSSSGDEGVQRGRTGRRPSDLSGNEDFEEARDTFDEKLAPPPSFGTEGRVSGSPVRDSKFQEQL
ncbi:Eisosome assembly protein [Coniosporium apollinis]|uniref:Eisosome assembly protein n=1 Tax=Coniosporium apollinis TaxID=61459 RepID=A0ABQ9NP92_9PEZI|nr:Eisosome assembly protein [Coniosporium apollinis]